MAEDWLADVRKYVHDADELVVKKIVNYCGIALRKRDSSLVSMSDPKETARVRDNYLKKKLGLTQDDATLDNAIQAVGQRMQADRTKNRVTVYYLLAEHFDMLDLFGGAKRGSDVGGARAAALAGGAMGIASLPGGSASADATPADAPTATDRPADPPAAAPVPAPAAAAVTASAPAALASAPSRHSAIPPESDGMVETGVIAFAAVVGAMILAMVIAGFVSGRNDDPVVIPRATEPATAPAPAAAPAAPATAPATVPTGAGVIASQQDTRPMLTVYFDTGKAEVTPDFAAASVAVRDYLAANPGSKLAISGYNDPTGNAAANAELSKRRAQAVQAALVGQGVDEARAELVKPEETTTTDLTPEQARRVEVTIVEGG
ncbi:DUF2853 family protein [Parerythrobacter lacustris]|uniref:DUF2853 family protein n=1 Tax=Parerythrobacter lacustris TaxID=2969984 RepID=A0ABT1XNQ3_9SPHN|nr:DUF2853 family protein [Parerythrobacter lacustris]MCR2832889.1 DUF2853 family protein [Parerythrobacter lacustris]